MSFIEETSQVKGGTGPEEDGGETTAEFVRLKKWVLEGHNKRRAWFDEAARAYDFVANHQWSQEDLNQLEEQNRPAVSFNRAAPIIKAVCGLEINNRQAAIYLPRTIDDTGIDESRSDCAKWVRDVCDAEDEESESFRDLVICGEGWVETRMDYEEDYQGRIIEERIDPLEMGVDASAHRKNYKDARMIYRIREIDAADARAMFDDEYTAEALHASWITMESRPADGGEGDKKDYPDETRDALERDSGKRSKVRLVQVQWWEREKRVLVAQQGSEELLELTDSEFKKFQERATQMMQADADAMQAHVAAMEDYMARGSPIEEAPPVAPEPTAPQFSHARVTKRCYYQAFLGSGLINKEKLEMNRFSFNAMTGERDRKKRCFYGMLRDMFDPQQWGNKWVSQTMHIMNTNAKGGIMAETDAVTNVRRMEQDWADNSKIIWVKPGALKNKKIQERTPPPLPQGLGELMQFAMSSMYDVTGVNLELLGQADREQAASLEAQRRRSAMTILATMFDSLRRFRKEQGRTLLHYIELLPEGTLYRVLDQGKWKWVPLIKKGDVREYDVVIDQAPTSPDQRREIWALTTTLLSQGLPLPMPVIVKLLKYSPYPESVVQEITEAMGLGAEMPPEMLKQKLQQAEQALQVLEQQLKQAMEQANTQRDELRISQLEAMVKAYKAETERLSAMWSSSIQASSAAADAARTPDPGSPQPASQPASGGGNQQLEAKVDAIAGLLQQVIGAMQAQGGQAVALSPPQTTETGM